MSTLRYVIRDLHEVIVAKDGHITSVSKCNNDTHGKEVFSAMCKSWNEMDWAETSKFFDEPIKGKVSKSIAQPLPDGKGIIIKTTFVEGFRLSEKRRNAFWDEMEAQMCDGWGEGEFGAGNIRKFADGTCGYVE